MWKFLVDEKGTETVEWAIMAGLVVAGLVVTVGLIGDWTYDALNALQGDLSSAGTPGAGT
jgi:Flp pilus assembly pilin Flp